MSQYLAKFYCGNKKNLCNYNEPIEYKKMLDRQFNLEQYDIVNNCKGYGKQKGYCCDKNGKDANKIMDKTLMASLNDEFKQNIFHTSDGKIEDHIPLIKTYSDKFGNLASIDVCNCGGEEDEYKKCVEEKCPDFRTPTKYEYCKMGTSDNSYKCFTDIETEYDYIAPSETLGDFPSYSPEPKKHIFGRCKLAPFVEDSDDVMSNNFKINNLYPDCYLNLCNKKPENQTLENVANNNYEKNVYTLYDNHNNIGFVDVKNNKKVQNNGSIRDILLK